MEIVFIILLLLGMALFGIVPIVLGGIAYKHAVGDAMRRTRHMALAAILLGVFWFFAIPALSLSLSSARNT